MYQKMEQLLITKMKCFFTPDAMSLLIPRLKKNRFVNNVLLRISKRRQWDYVCMYAKTVQVSMSTRVSRYDLPRGFLPTESGSLSSAFSPLPWYFVVTCVVLMLISSNFWKLIMTAVTRHQHIWKVGARDARRDLCKHMLDLLSKVYCQQPNSQRQGVEGTMHRRCCFPPEPTANWWLDATNTMISRTLMSSAFRRASRTAASDDAAAASSLRQPLHAFVRRPRRDNLRRTKRKEDSMNERMKQWSWLERSGSKTAIQGKRSLRFRFLRFFGHWSYQICSYVPVVLYVR